MKTLKLYTQLLSVVSLIFILSHTALAVPVFQVYTEDGVAGTVGDDQDTWFTTNESLGLLVAAAYGPKTESVTDVTLIVSVPVNETGTISIIGADGATTLVCKSGRLIFPGCDRKIFDLDKILHKNFKIKNGDVIIIGSGSTKKKAEEASIISALSLT